MDPHTMLILVVAVGLVSVGWLLLEMRGQLSESQTRQLLQTGAKVIDVRTPDEFNGGHLKGAVNLPYRNILDHIESVVPDRSAPVLLHCLSGGRSAIAQRLLRKHGYAQVFNLGSLRRAQKLTGLAFLTKTGTSN